MQNKWQDKTKILLNIIEIYESINIQVEQQLIHPTRGVPQESVFVLTLFLISIDEILKKLEKNKNIQVQVFVDDIAITTNNILYLQGQNSIFCPNPSCPDGSGQPAAGQHILAVSVKIIIRYLLNSLNNIFWKLLSKKKSTK